MIHDNDPDGGSPCLQCKEKLDQIGKLTQRLQAKYPTETNAFLGFLKKAEAGPALDEFLPEN